LEHERLIGLGGSGSPLSQSMPRFVDAASGVSELSGFLISFLRLRSASA
jgi:hypothetical protein